MRRERGTPSGARRRVRQKIAQRFDDALDARVDHDRLIGRAFGAVASALGSARMRDRRTDCLAAAYKAVSDAWDNVKWEDSEWRRLGGRP